MYYYVGRKRNHEGLVFFFFEKTFLLVLRLKKKTFRYPQKKVSGGEGHCLLGVVAPDL